MERKLISEISAHENQNVYIKGWVHRLRKLKSVTFIIIRDRSGLIQCVLSPELETAMGLEELTSESTVALRGVVCESKNAYGAYEIVIEHLDILCLAQSPLPIQVNLDDLDINLDTLLDNRVLGLRHPKEMAIFKIQAALGQAFGTYLQSQGFTEMHTPKLVKEGAEGGANVFQLDYFGDKAFLAQSPQFYKQMMVLAGFERVYEVGSVFRAEAHSTSRHLNEYVSLDFEMGFIDSEFELMTLETELIRFMFEALNQNQKYELQQLGVTLPDVPKEIPHMKLADAIAILKTQYGKHELEGDLDPEGERLIGEHIFKETGSEFVFLTHYPQSKRPMYTLPCGETETHSFDLLFRGLEITTGGRRIHQIEQLKASMVRKGLDPNAYQSYLEAFKYGAIPHGGLAIGLERLTAQLLGFTNIRRTTLFPRDGHRLLP